MRLRPTVLLAGVVVAAALATAFVVTRLPREGEAARLAQAAAPPAATTPAAERAATPDDGLVELHATAAGAPLAGAEVQLYLQVAGAPGAPPAWRRAGAGRTGADGVARVAAWRGAYLAVVRAPGLAPGRAEVIRAEGEPTSRADVALAPPAALAGRVSGPGGGPVPARVTAIPLFTAFPGAAPGAPGEELASATCGVGGAFRLEGLAPGTYALRVEAPGLHPLLVARVAAPRAGPLALRLEALATIAGEVRGPDGGPAAGATVRAVSADHDAEATAGADGRFSLAVPAGGYHLLAARADAAGALAGALALAPGGAVRDLVVRLAPAAALEGVVTRTGGEPAPGAEVAVRPHGAEAVLARARAGAEGRFVVAGLPPGAWDVLAGAPGLTPARAEGVTVAAGQRFPLRLALAGPGAIEGVVTDPRGQPLAGVRVRVTSRGDGLSGAPVREARADDRGRFRLAELEAGRAELVAHEPRAVLGAVRSVRVREGQVARADLTLEPSGVLAGRAAAEGRPAPLGTAVVAVPLRAGLGTPQAARALTDAGGDYRLVVPAGEYRVLAAPAEATAPDLRVAPAFARVQAGLTRRLDVTVAAPAEEGGLEILVLEPGGAPSPGAVVTLSRPDDAKIALASQAGEDGRVRLAKDMGLAGRPAAVRVRNGGRSGAYLGPLPAGGTLAVTLAPGGAVEGVVRGGGGPPRAFTLEVASQPSPEGWRTLDVHRFAGDRFELGDLPAGPLRLTARTADGRVGEASVRLGAGESRAVEIALRAPGAARR